MSIPQIYTINSISELLRRTGLPKPLHPQVALVNYDQVKLMLTDAGNKFALNFYKISFKTDFNGRVKYGQGYYDFEEGGLAFLSPNQVVTMSGETESYQGYALYFHPDLIRGHPLAEHIHQYGFFAYAVSEALFLSDKEKKVISRLFEAIETELQHDIDHFSQDVLVAQIELLLTYSNRYYNRQFITRKVIYNSLIDQMNLYLGGRLGAQNPVIGGLPSVQDVADHLQVSPRYLTDMLKSLTGQSAQQHIHHQIIEKAKDILAVSNRTIAEIAYDLGFEHPQSFNKLFKQKTKMSPSAFRQSFDN
ncbi:AraC-like ligand binding domain-containing protein [Pedobacter westerhofensis]|uniref:AraC-like ligand binding domain-containing protein n=1 Tax=Pedobacter westerhofensis TaxID=425512 RepID=A0A521CZH2_9SPHI|nr:AraC family transcriptional regulator [Pedobacter westerhofensis]SMO64824.1 AraC-like ligand binding domain-containing protein [Pedobacter westerhofensis]